MSILYDSDECMGILVLPERAECCANSKLAQRETCVFKKSEKQNWLRFDYEF